jgi:hypothetical protein
MGKNHGNERKYVVLVSAAEAKRSERWVEVKSGECNKYIQDLRVKVE